MQYLDRMYIAARVKAAALRDRMKEGIVNFYTSEDGVSNVVATIIILLIVVIIIGVFWTQLSTFVGDLINDIFNRPKPTDQDLGVG